MTLIDPSTIEVETDIDIDISQKERLVRMVYGSGHFDHYGNYRDRSEDVHHLNKIVFQADPADGIPGGETQIDGVDALQFETPPFLYMVGSNGETTGWQHATADVASRWHHGAVVGGPDGSLWFCGKDEPSGDLLTGDEPLFQINPQTAHQVLFDNGPMIRQDGGRVVAEGEFWLSDEDVPMITSIPWWSSMDPEDAGLDPDVAARDREVVERIDERIRGIISETTSAPEF